MQLPLTCMRACVIGAEDYSLRNLLSRRQDLFLHDPVKTSTQGEVEDTYYRPSCVCCNQATGPSWQYFKKGEEYAFNGSSKYTNGDTIGAKHPACHLLPNSPFYIHMYI